MGYTRRVPRKRRYGPDAARSSGARSSGTSKGQSVIDKAVGDKAVKVVADEDPMRQLSKSSSTSALMPKGNSPLLMLMTDARSRNKEKAHDNYLAERADLLELVSG